MYTNIFFEKKKDIYFIRDVERAKVSLKAYFASRGANIGSIPRSSAAIWLFAPCSNTSEFYSEEPLFCRAKKLVQPGIISTIINVGGQINAIAWIFADIWIFRQKPIQKYYNQNNYYI